MASKLAAVLVAALLLTATATAHPAQAANVGQCSPGLGIGLLQVPRETLDDPRARNYIVDSVKPGATFARDFQVCNGTLKPMTVQLYPDSATIVDGGFTLAPGRGENELTRWMTVTPPTLVIPSGKAVKATLSFAVPIDAEAGERYAGVVADAPPASNGGIAIGGRVGIRVYLDVSKGGAPKSDFSIDSLQAIRMANGTPAVLAKVHNIGARALDMRGELQLSEGPGGLSAGPFPAQLGTTLAPGHTAQVTVPLPPAITGGPWRAVIEMQSGVLERRAEARLTFPEAAGAAAPPVKATELPLLKDTKKVGLFAALLIGILALILLLLALRAFLARKRRALLTA